MPASIIDIMMDNAYRQIQTMVSGPQALQTLHNLIMLGGMNLVKCGQLSSFLSCTEDVQCYGALIVTVTYQEFWPMDVKTVTKDYPYLDWNGDCDDDR